MALITCTDLSLGYEGKVAASHINFHVNQGDYLSIVGENGSGKSTLMKGILGLLKPIKGSITLGEGLTHTHIGYLPQQQTTGQDFPASVQEVVLSGRLNQSGLWPFYTKKDRRIAQENMELMGIYDLRKTSFKELSGGQRQRVLLSRALCATTKMLLLDEPVSGLDPIVTAELYQAISTLQANTGITIIMISHDIHKAWEHASHVLHMGGAQAFFGTSAAYQESDIGQAFAVVAASSKEVQE